MAYVIPLGEYGKPRESMLSGLSEALTQGMAVGEQARHNRESESIQKEQISSNQKQALNIAKMELQKSKIEQDQQNKDKNHAKELWLQYSNYINMQKPELRETLLTHPNHDAMVKTLKKHLPEVFDNDGKLILPPSKDIYQMKIEDNTEAILSKVKNGDKISPHEQQYLDFVNKVGSGDLATAISSNTGGLGQPTPGEPEFANNVMKTLELMKKLRGQPQVDNSSTGIKSPISGALEKDPLGIMSGGL